QGAAAREGQLAGHQGRDRPVVGGRDDGAVVGERHLRDRVGVGVGPRQLLGGGGGPVGGERGGDAGVGAGERGQRSQDEVLGGVDRLGDAGDGLRGEQQLLDAAALVVVRRAVGGGLAGPVQLARRRGQEVGRGDPGPGRD